jgi:hypothetical protein
MVELYLHSLKYLHGVVLNQLSEGVLYLFIFKQRFIPRDRTLYNHCLFSESCTTGVKCDAFKVKAGGTWGNRYALLCLIK